MSRIFKCPYCTNKYLAENKEKYSEAKIALYTHMEEKHKEELGGLSPAQAYFNYVNKKTRGSCVICKKETKWSETTERYERFCSDKCKEEYRKRFLESMKKAGKADQMNDPEFQKKMLQNRKISGKYKWSNGKTETPYTGSYEKDFLEYLDTVLNMNPTDVIGPAPQTFYYEYDGKKHFYIADFYISSMNLLIEIKDGEDNPNRHSKIQKVDKVKEKLKDEVMAKQKEFDYLKIEDKDYAVFLNFLLNKKFEEK